MNKDELKSKIKQVASKILGGGEEEKQFVDLDNIGPNEEKFSYFQKFPQLKDVVVELLTDKFYIFVKEVQWVAPKPTTFKIILANNQYFFLIYEEDDWMAQIEGKKYYVSSLKEKQNALNALSRVLRYGFQETEKEEIPSKPEEEETEAEEETK